MSRRTAITVGRDRAEIARLWDSPGYRTNQLEQTGARVSYKDAPGDRGTEIHVEVAEDGGGVGAALRMLRRASALAKAKDELRRFKQRVETGVIPRSDGSPEGETAERKLKQRPAQPLKDAELEKVGVA
jgi:uncharacterized membrane protein